MTEEARHIPNLAGAGERFLAWVIDMFISFLAAFGSAILGFAIGWQVVTASDNPQGGVFCILFLTFGFGIAGELGRMSMFTWMVAKRGQSPGKMVARIRIVDTDGRRIGGKRAIIREIVAKWLVQSAVAMVALPAMLALDLNGGVTGWIPFVLYWTALFVWLILDVRKQTLHDKIAKTFVVRVKPEPLLQTEPNKS